jgi:hypothetical protein
MEQIFEAEIRRDRTTDFKQQLIAVAFPRQGVSIGGKEGVTGDHLVISSNAGFVFYRRTVVRMLIIPRSVESTHDRRRGFRPLRD